VADPVGLLDQDLGEDRESKRGLLHRRERKKIAEPEGQYLAPFEATERIETALFRLQTDKRSPQIAFQFGPGAAALQNLSPSEPVQIFRVANEDLGEKWARPEDRGKQMDRGRGSLEVRKQGHLAPAGSGEALQIIKRLIRIGGIRQRIKQCIEQIRQMLPSQRFVRKRLKICVGSAIVRKSIRPENRRDLGIVEVTVQQKFLGIRLRHTGGIIPEVHFGYSTHAMTPVVLHRELASRVPDLPTPIVESYAAAAAPEYLEAYSLAEIAGHLRAIGQLGSLPLRLRITELGPDVFEVRIAARDYFSELAVIAGLLAAFGLNIEEGYLATAGGYILDIFRVRPVAVRGFAKPAQQEFERELSQLIELLAENRFQEARARLNRRLTEVIARSPGLPAVLQPVDVRFENLPGAAWTSMEITASDTPGFLYALANALGMRGITVHSGTITSRGQHVHDRFGVTDRYGRRITDPRGQAALRMTTVLIKQFTHCLSAAPDPAKALAHFDQLLDHVLELAPDGRLPAFLHERATLDLLARLFGTSDFLWEDFLRANLETLLPVLQEAKAGPARPTRSALRRGLRRALGQAASYEQQKVALNQFKDRELFRIDMRHLMDPRQQLEPFALALTELAEVILQETLLLCQKRLARTFDTPQAENGRACAFAICALGKFGGREMGYASDIELLFVYDGAGQTDGQAVIAHGEYFERLCQEILRFIEAKQQGIFHLDVRLRPHGQKSLLAVSLREMKAYYSAAGTAAPFERQALTKLRRVAGSRALGARVESLRDRFVYSSGPWDIATAVTLRHRQASELVPTGLTNVKYSPGGLIDIEYAVQYLQIAHGARYKSVRRSSTLDALRALRRLGKLSIADDARLVRNYRFLRRLIDALRIVRGNARDLVLPPADSEEFIYLARRMGYQGKHWRIAAARLQRDIQRHMAETRRFFSSRFGY
jgi:[glutamine synthetase] adenylyltransferase / [glutamine synthetase]-adenylyl-L-tyrosine phosphorylase